ncbi:PKD domain-containing protein, partial [Roseovarius aestuarii]|nr:PKD domain-containing protein [Roseovarius aestuarii]
MRKILISGLIAGTLATAGTGAGAFTAADDINQSYSVGSCSVFTLVASSLRSAATYLYHAGNYYDSGGTYFQGDSIFSNSPITPSILEACHGSDYSVSNFLANGANGTFATDTYIGFSYTLTNTATSAVTNHEYKVGSGTIVIPNTPPTANAGADQTVASGAAVTLDGSGSRDPDTGQTLTYTWSQTEGTTVTLSDVNADKPSFTAPVLVAGSGSETLKFQLSFGDGIATDTDTVEIKVEAPANTPPTADAGPDQIVGLAGLGTLIVVKLNGSGSSDPDTGQTLTYSWRLVSSGYKVSIASADTATPSFLSPLLLVGNPDVTLTLELTVSDGIATDTDTVKILLRAPVNTLPTADAGADQTVDSGAVVTLDGSGSSDPD